MKAKNNKGFTLVELIVVIAIIGILAAVLIPSITGYIEKARLSNDTQDVKNMNTILSLNAIEDDVSYYEAYEVQKILNEEHGYSLVPRVKGYVYWYDRSTNKVQLENNAENSLIPIVDAAVNFRADRLEAIAYNKPEYLYIDLSENEITTAINTIRHLVTIAKNSLEAGATKLDVVNKMETLFNEVTAYFEEDPYLKTHFSNFSLENSMYVDEEGFYTKAIIGNNILTVSRIVIEPECTIIPSFDIIHPTLNTKPEIQIVEGELLIPKSVTTIMNGAFSTLQSSVTVISKNKKLFNESNLNPNCVVDTKKNINQTMIIPIAYNLTIGDSTITVDCKQDIIMGIPKAANFSIKVEKVNYVFSNDIRFEISNTIENGIHVYKVFLYDSTGSIIAKGIIKYYEI